MNSGSLLAEGPQTPHYLGGIKETFCDHIDKNLGKPNNWKKLLIWTPSFKMQTRVLNELHIPILLSQELC